MDDQQALQEQILTRQELGGTVEALAATADLKARAPDKAGQVKRVGEQVGEVREKASEQARQIQHGAQEFTDKLRQTVATQPAARRRSIAALTAAGVVVAVAWLVLQRRPHRESRKWGRR